MDETQLRPGVGSDPIGHNGRKAAIERPKVRLGPKQTSLRRCTDVGRGLISATNWRLLSPDAEKKPFSLFVRHCLLGRGPLVGDRQGEAAQDQDDACREHQTDLIAEHC